MSKLLRKPIAQSGLIQDITPENADWGYVGFQVWKLKAGESASQETGAREAILVIVEGKAKVSGGDVEFGELGERMSVFERTPPHCVYVPNAADWQVEATTDCVIGVCTAPGKGGHEARKIGPEGIQTTTTARC